MPRKYDRSAVSPVDVAQAYREVFTTEAGSIVLADLQRRFAFINRTTHVPGDRDTSFVQEGQRTVIIEIGRQLTLDLAQLQEKMTEG